MLPYFHLGVPPQPKDSREPLPCIGPAPLSGRQQQAVGAVLRIGWSTAGGVIATTGRDCVADAADESGVDGGAPSRTTKGSAFSRGNQSCRKEAAID
jgi:hypothetical protein